MLLRFGYYGCYSFHKANLTTAISAPLGLRKRGLKKKPKVMELRPTKHIRKVSPFA